MAKSAARVADLDTTLLVYYENYDLGSKEIRMLFGENLASSTIAKLKKRSKRKKPTGMSLRKTWSMRL